MNDEQEIEEAERQAAWTTVLAVRDGDIAKAAYHAGAAYAYFQCRDAIGRLEGKLADAKKKKA